MHGDRRLISNLEFSSMGQTLAEGLTIALRQGTCRGEAVRGYTHGGLASIHLGVCEDGARPPAGRQTGPTLKMQYLFSYCLSSFLKNGNGLKL